MPNLQHDLKQYSVQVYTMSYLLKPATNTQLAHIHGGNSTHQHTQIHYYTSQVAADKQANKTEVIMQLLLFSVHIINCRASNYTRQLSVQLQSQRLMKYENMLHDNNQIYTEDSAQSSFCHQIDTKLGIS